MSRHALSRRTVLRGAGTAIALPLLDAMVTDSGLLHGRAHAASPVRLVTWFWPNGTLANKWDPTVVGNITAQNLSAMTQAFAPVAGKPDILPYLTFVSGVGSRIWMSGHSAAMMAAGQGGTDDHDNFGNWPTAATIDQVFASKHGANTRLPSMALAGTSTNTLGWGILSWKDGGRPITPFAKPLAVFDALFGAAAPAPVGGGTSTPPPPGAAELAAMRRKSVLDFVKAEAGRLNQRLGTADRTRIDEHLQSIRELEKQIFATAPAGTPGTPSPGTATVSGCEVPSRTAYASTNLGDSFRAGDKETLLIKLMVLGLRCDLTRTMSFMLDQASGQKRYPGGPDSGDHDTSHKQDESATRSATNAKLSYLANFLRDCAAVKEGDRTMLDSMVVYSNSDVNDGNAHDRDKTLPIVIAGHAGGALKGGRHVRFPSATPLNDLLSSLLNYCEVPTGKFGSQGSGPLGGL